jgi:hypothetical protein
MLGVRALRHGAEDVAAKNNANFAVHIEILFSAHGLMTKPCAILAQGSSLVEADFPDQGACRLLMCGNLIDWQSVGWERSDLDQNRIAVRC